MPKHTFTTKEFQEQIRDQSLVMPPQRRHKAPEGECKSCDEFRAEKLEFHPSHDAGRYCESGKHNHCTCDMCF